MPNCQTAFHRHTPGRGNDKGIRVLPVRGIYITDERRNWLSAHDANRAKWGDGTEEWWKFYATRGFANVDPFSIAGFTGSFVRSIL
jgi:hypothetical protein